MKKILLLALAFMSVNVFAQEGKADMSKYMGDIIPLEDGKVVFSTTIEAQGLASGQIYDIAYRWMELFLKERKVDRRERENGR